MSTYSRKIELLAPAKNLDIAIDAINHGTDAVYIGASGFGARAAAGNSLEDVAQVVEYAHKFNAKVYVTLNTIIKDDEISEVEKLITSLYEIGVDALIVQDLGILRMNIPPIQLHASTQCDICTVEKAQFLENMGFSQLVLARELSLSEIKEISDNVHVPIEVFVHGALCVSYSGRCHVSYANKGRSANRGECAQICRLPYDVIDGRGEMLMKGKHILSLRDLNRSDDIGSLLDAGASSFKIEGRLKEAGYVKNVVAGYSIKINKEIAKSPEKYKRSSCGEVEYNFTPALNKSFNRGFTDYFLNRKPNNQSSMAMLLTPKSLGEPIGEVTRVYENKIWVKSVEKLNNGDGLSFFNQYEEYEGFRINKVENDVVFTLTPVAISKGTKLYRTYNKAFSDEIEMARTRRFIRVQFILKQVDEFITLNAIDERGNSASIALSVEGQVANTNQRESQIKVLSKLGNTIYKATDISTLDNIFIPSSQLAQAKRDVIKLLDKEQKKNYKVAVRDSENIDYRYYNNTITYRDNVANRLAKTLYIQHGVNAENIEMALESDASRRITENDILMTTRYCLRRELDCCLKTDAGKNIVAPIYLKSGDISLKVEFDCKACEMKIYNT